MADKLSVDEFVEMFGQYTVIELAEMKEKLKDKYNIEAAVAPMAGAGVPGAAEGAEEEKTEFDVVLTSTGDQKIKVIKAIREVTDLGLKEAKALADDPPKPVRSGVNKEEAEKVKSRLEEVGAAVEIK